MIKFKLAQMVLIVVFCLSLLLQLLLSCPPPHPPTYFYSHRHLKFHKSPREKTDGLWLRLRMHLQKSAMIFFFSSKKEKQRYLPTADRNLKERSETSRNGRATAPVWSTPKLSLCAGKDKTIWLSRDYSLMQSSILLVLLIRYVLLYDLTIRRLDQMYKSPI